MAQFRRGVEAIQAATKGGGSGKFKPIFQFESDEISYLQFLTPMDEVPTVLMHQFIKVGEYESGKPNYERFISRRDPALDGPDGYDELIDRFGSNPSQRCIAVAVELVPEWEKKGTKKVLKGFDIAMREYTDKEGNEHEVPNVVLVIESPYTLYGSLSAVNDLKPIEDYVWAINVTGKGKDKTFTPTDVGPAIDFEGELDEFIAEIDFDGYLDELADEDRMRELIEPLPDTYQVNKYAKKGKGGKKAEDTEEDKPRRQSTRTQRARTEEPDEPEASTEDSDVSGGEEEAPAPRRRKFSELRREMSTTS